MAAARVDADATLARATPFAHPSDHRSSALERVAFALNSSLELGEVLHLLADAGLAATGAAGTAVLLLEGRRLTPAAVVRVVGDPTLHERFFQMCPVDLDDKRWKLLQRGRAIVFEDARASELIPRELVDRFALRGFALVPLMAAEEPFGLMCVDWDEVRSFAPADVELLEAFGAYAGVAVKNARVYGSMRRRAHVQAVLAKSATNLASPVPPDVIAGRLVDAYAQLTGAELCAIAMLDESWQSITTVAVRGGRELAAPIPMSEIPAQVVHHVVGRLEGTRRPAALSMTEWFTEYLRPNAAVCSYLAVPIVVGALARGLVLLGFASSGASLGEDESAACEVLAGIAAAALERHELLDELDSQVRRLAALQDVSAALNSSASVHEVLGVVSSAFESILGASSCSVTVLDAGADLPVIDDRAAVLFPLATDGRQLGVVVAGFPRQRTIDAKVLETGRALADLAATAVDRAALGEASRLRLQQVETLYGLSDVVAGTADLDDAMVELNRRVEPELGTSFAAVVVANRELREIVGGRAPDDEELEAIRSWRSQVGKGKRVRPRPAGVGEVLVPVVHRARVYGALRVVIPQGDASAATEDLLGAIGAGCAQIIYKAGLHRELAERERRLAIATERERIAQDLHDSVGQVMTGVGMTWTKYLDDAPDDEWRRRIEDLVRIARNGASEIRDAVHSLMFLETRHLGLVASLRDLAKKFHAMTGIDIGFELDGEPVPLSAAKEDALFRVAHEALMNVERHSGAASASLLLRYEPACVRLVVRDDGVGLARVPRCGGHGDDGARHLGLTALDRRIGHVGGELAISAGETAGTVVEATVPFTTKRDAAARPRSLDRTKEHS